MYTTLIANLVEDSEAAPFDVSSDAFWEKMGVSAATRAARRSFCWTPVEQANAKKVLALLQKGRHWVLVVLLLSNVIINESLPIFLDSAIGGGVASVLLSTTAIVIFGVIPQSLSVRYGLTVGAACAPLHPNGALELGKKSVEQIMTPMKDVVTLDGDVILDDKLLEFILNSGYSRFPVHEKGNPDAFIGLLLVKKLLRYDISQACTVSSLPLSILPEAHPGISCFQALDYLWVVKSLFLLPSSDKESSQTGRAHLLLISRTPGRPGGALGLVTLEDVIEEILAEEIVDETDWYGDNVTKQPARRTTTPAVMQGIVESPRRYPVTIPADSPAASYYSYSDERTPLLQLGGAPQNLLPNPARTPSMMSPLRFARVADSGATNANHSESTQADIMQSKLIASFSIACFATLAFAAPVAEPELPRVEEVRAPEPQPGCTLYSCV
ncbi:hypothetical protein C8F01DRAFT_1269285 [Mycena amicta]|nr:hypothetical protein C8F01DRAFT_1269285 [Mycena amicta]